MRVLAGALVRLGAQPVLPATLRDGTKVVLDARSRTESSALWNGTYDEHDIAFMLASLEPPATFVDIGANVGLITLPVARWLAPDGGRVVAFEPIGVNAARLHESVGLNRLSNVTLVRRAVGAETSTMVMLKEGRDAASGNAMAERPGDGRARGELVDCVTLDDALDAADVRDIAFIKLDVEGYEFEVLRGALRTIDRSRPIVYGEFHNVLMPRFGANFCNVAALFEPRRYRFFKFTGEFSAHEVDPQPDHGNVVLVPAERVDWWLQRLATDAPLIARTRERHGA
jgi:FkbM family methyltransferase